MILAYSKSLFTLNEKDAKIMKSEPVPVKKVKTDGKFKVKYSLLTQFQMFIVYNLPCLTRFIKNGKRKSRMIQKTRDIIHQQTDVNSLIKNMWNIV